MFGPCFLPASQETVKHVAVAVGHPNRSPHFHAVILYRDSSGAVHGLDINLAGIISSTPLGMPTAAFAWAVPDFDDDVLEQVASFCESVGKEPRHLTYAFEIGSSSQLAKRGDHFVAIGSDGFTCATLVLAIFQSLLVPLIDLASWHMRQEDTDWQKEVIALMKKLRDRKKMQVTDAHLEALEKQLPCIRYSPHIVIGACRVGGHPSHCQPSYEAGHECLRWLEQSITMRAT